MDRNAMKQLVDWKASPERKPLILRGARQVGKTWLMKEFGRAHYSKTAYVNFEDNPRMDRLFTGDLDPKRIIAGLQIETDQFIDPADTLLVFDEVQEVPRALTSLKYFNENAPAYDILAAGSLLGISLHPGTSFPVGKVGFLDVRPLTFDEFMRAVGSGRYADALDSDSDLAESFRETYIGLLSQYFFVGGMPEAVAAFSRGQDYQAARTVQQNILASYELDFSKHAPNDIVPRLRQIWESLPTQLARENRKFSYGQIRQGARAREFETAMQWLLDAGLMRKVHRVPKAGLPLVAYRDPGSFKLYHLDVGLLGAASSLDAATLLQGSRIFEEFKGALTEQYVLQQLEDACQDHPFYWSPDTGNAEVDFVVQVGGGIYPIEVKAGENLQAKSLRVYRDKYQPRVSVRTSLSGFRREEWLVNIPLYAIATYHNTLSGSTPDPGPAR